MDTVSPSLTWTMSDDTSAPADMTARILVEEVPATGVGASTMVYSEAEAAGATNVTLRPLDPGKAYKLTLTVADQAQNETSMSFLFTVSPHAAGACGCHVGATPTGGSPVALFGFVLGLAFVVRRRRAA
jgi:MYXO-CTERM domain-containing protein